MNFIHPHVSGGVAGEYVFVYVYIVCAFLTHTRTLPNDYIYENTYATLQCHYTTHTRTRTTPSGHPVAYLLVLCTMTAISPQPPTLCKGKKIPIDYDEKERQMYE